MKIMTKGSLALLTVLTIGGLTTGSVEAKEMNTPKHTESVIDKSYVQPIIKPNTKELPVLPSTKGEKEVPKLEKADEIKITVDYGDTLNNIAEQFNVSVDSLQYNNDIEETHKIVVGENLIIGGNKFEEKVPDSFYKEQRVKAEAKKIAAELKVKEEEKAKADAQAKVVAEQERVANEKAKQEKQEAAKQQEVVQTQPAKVVQKSEPVQQQAQPVQKKAQPKQEVKAQPKKEAKATTNTNSGYQVTVEATAYSRNQPSLSNFTANGTDLRQNPNVIAVNPSQIPLGSQVYIPGYGTFTAADTGGDISHGRIDIHMESLNSATNFGRRNITVTVLN